MAMGGSACQYEQQASSSSSSGSTGGSSLGLFAHGRGGLRRRRVPAGVVRRVRVGVVGAGARADGGCGGQRGKRRSLRHLEADGVCGEPSLLAGQLAGDAELRGHRRAAAVLLMPITCSDDHGVHQRSPNGDAEGSNRLASHVRPGCDARPLYWGPPPSQRLWNPNAEPPNRRELLSGNHPSPSSY
ncbi:hypothetical protein OsJ_10680 [Oryza sativa Japonica Group]|uniref:Uncharacterized protein n=1 Tax=Oryza sativa subsp. japonica TaxID=39947 RepID=B9F880_ORYSJ|nr:hypothetical protein OsJ_10680 [Oryza sativa Japonica Group]